MPTFLKSIEVRYRKHNLSENCIIKTFELLLQEKHELELKHKTIVQRGLNPYLGRKVPQTSKPLTRSKEFMVKKSPLINHSVISTTHSPYIAEYHNEPFEFIPLAYDDDAFDLPMSTSHITDFSKPSTTCIRYAEDLFGAKKLPYSSPKILSNPKTSQLPIRANFNNPYIRKIAGNTLSPPIIAEKPSPDDPLSEAESYLPAKLRSSSKSSPWVYSSLLRNNQIYKLKKSSRGKRKPKKI